MTFKSETVLYRKGANAGQKTANMDTGSIGLQKGSATFCRWEESGEEHKLSTFLNNVVSISDSGITGI